MRRKLLFEMSQPFPDFLPHGMGGEMKDRRGKPADPRRYKIPSIQMKILCVLTEISCIRMKISCV